MTKIIHRFNSNIFTNQIGFMLEKCVHYFAAISMTKYLAEIGKSVKKLTVI